MKKLLALILCVMMFVSVIPTSAFAANPTYDTKPAGTATADPTTKAALEAASEYKKQIENMIKNTKKNVETAYGVLAMDQVVYSSAKSMDDVIGNLVTTITDQLTGKTVNGTKFTAATVKTLKDNTKAHLRALVQALVIDEIDNSKYTDDKGKINPVKYAQEIANAVNKALNNKDFQAGYQAVATYFALANVADSINDELKKQRDAFKESIDADFNKDFATNYPALYNVYMESIPASGNMTATDWPWDAYVTPGVGAWD